MTTKGKTPSKTKTARELALMVLQSRKPNVLSTVEVRPSKHSLLKACIFLRDVGAGDLAIELYGWALAEYPIERGRRPAGNGEQRIYSVQRTREGIPFARIPLHTLGVEFGEKIVCEFNAGSINITALNPVEEDGIEFKLKQEPDPKAEKSIGDKPAHPDSVFARYTDE